MKPPRLAKAPWSDLILVCEKCTRKAGAKRFHKTLKTELKERVGKRFRIVQSTCLDICPKGRIVIATAADLTKARLLVVQPDEASETARYIVDRVGEAAVPVKIDSPQAGP